MPLAVRAPLAKALRRWFDIMRGRATLSGEEESVAMSNQRVATIAITISVVMLATAAVAYAIAGGAVTSPADRDLPKVQVRQTLESVLTHSASSPASGTVSPGGASAETTGGAEIEDGDSGATDGAGGAAATDDGSENEQEPVEVITPPVRDSNDDHGEQAPEHDGQTSEVPVTSAPSDD